MTATTERDPRCGTSAGYMAHRYAGEPICEDCRTGHAARIAAHRAKHGRRDQLVNRARGRAINRLAKEYPARLAELYETAKAEVFAEARGESLGSRTQKPHHPDGWSDHRPAPPPDQQGGWPAGRPPLRGTVPAPVLRGPGAGATTHGGAR